jgi:hypothetical protein
MSQPSDLMGLGMPPLLADRIADAGPSLTVLAAGSAFSSATRLLANQNMATCANANGTLALGLPQVGNDVVYLGDQYVISNTGTTSIQLFGSTGVLINTNGSNGSQQPILQNRTMILWPVSTTQWIAINGS